MIKDASKIFKALSDTNRLRILKMLDVRQLCVCEITEVLNLATSTVSKHLAILKEAELISDRKEGRWVTYKLSDSEVSSKITDLLHDFEISLGDCQTINTDAVMVKTVDKIEICCNKER